MQDLFGTYLDHRWIDLDAVQDLYIPRINTSFAVNIYCARSVQCMTYEVSRYSIATVDP